MIYTYMVGVYAVLVKGGKWVLTAEGNKENLPVVPEAYVEKVAEYLASQASE